MVMAHCNQKLLCAEATRLLIRFVLSNSPEAQPEAIQQSVDSQRLVLYRLFEWVDLLEGDCLVCQQRIYFWQAGGHRMRTGPLYRIQKQHRIRQWLKWKKDWIAAQQGSDWVWGSSHQFPYRLQRKPLY